MKQAMSFRFSNRTITRLSVLSKKLHLSKTDILERAINCYAKRQIRSQSDLIEFAGVFSEEAAN